MATTSDDKPEVRKQQTTKEGRADLIAWLRVQLGFDDVDDDKPGTPEEMADLASRLRLLMGNEKRDDKQAAVAGSTGTTYPDELPPGLVIKIVKARGDLLDKERELLRAKLRDIGGLDKLR